jgi:succinate dehydrogenase / fumarate reductase flavoprotein subunit
MWEHCGMARTAEGLETALAEIPKLREAFWADARVHGSGDSLNASLEKAGRVADFLEFAEVMCHDALTRDESCGGHFREEHRTEEGEAVRHDDDFSHAAVWEFQGVGEVPKRNVEPMSFNYVKLTTRSYK